MMAENKMEPKIEEKEVVPAVNLECAVCLQNCVYPVQLPCKHIFCFLCVKGVTLQSKRCAMCRREIPSDYLFNPELLSQDTGTDSIMFDDAFQWFYEGRNGWWQYDQRTSVEIEKHHKDGDKRCELLIAGFLYIVDFEHMFQYRRNDPSRRRKVKRDIATGPKKGVAGLRIGAEPEPELTTDTGTQSTDSSQGTGQGSGLDPISSSADQSQGIGSSQGSGVEGPSSLDPARGVQDANDRLVVGRPDDRDEGGALDGEDGSEEDDSSDIDEVSSQLVHLGISETTRSKTF